MKVPFGNLKVGDTFTFDDSFEDGAYQRVKEHRPPGRFAVCNCIRLSDNRPFKYSNLEIVKVLTRESS